MDLYSLLAGLRPCDSTSRKRKTTSLYASFKAALGSAPELTFAQFIEAVPDTVFSTQFGSPAEDSYLTALLATIGRADPSLDLILAGVLNHSMLELTNQRRFLHRGRPPEAFVLDGDRRYFFPAMANNSFVAGLLACKDDLVNLSPAWAQNDPSISIKQNLLRVTPLGQLASEMRSLNCTDIGTLAIIPEQIIEPFDLANRYANVAGFVNEQTRYLIAGSAELVLFAADALQQADQSAQVSARLYATHRDGGNQHRGVVVASGFSALPNAIFSRRARRTVTVSTTEVEMAAGDESIRAVNYGLTHGIFETVAKGRPFAMSSSVALPPKMRERISRPSDCIYVAHELKDGILIPTSNGGAYYAVSASDHLLKNCGFTPGVGEEFWRDGQTAQDGKHHFPISCSEITRVQGCALPLAFTPTLHNFHSHFIQQCFPRVLILDDLGLSDAKLIVSKSLRTYQKEMLAAVGYGEDRLIYADTGVAVQAGSLLCPIIWPNIISPYTKRIYDKLVGQLKPSDTVLPRRVLLSREANTNYRNLVNYETIKTLLTEEYGFTHVRPEALSINDEIRLFNEADIVVGSEGAGMYNGCFSRAGSIYISLINEDYTMPGLGSLATVCGIKVAYVCGEALFADQDHSLPFLGGHSDFMIDPEHVREIVEEAIAYLEN
jgi:hypothetical protein